MEPEASDTHLPLPLLVARHEFACVLEVDHDLLAYPLVVLLPLAPSPCRRCGGCATSRGSSGPSPAAVTNQSTEENRAPSLVATDYTFNLNY